VVGVVELVRGRCAIGRERLGKFGKIPLKSVVFCQMAGFKALWIEYYHFRGHNKLNNKGIYKKEDDLTVWYLII
jgi:hypothetical protein